jgi:hypothetical protein
MKEKPLFEERGVILKAGTRIVQAKVVMARHCIS